MALLFPLILRRRNLGTTSNKSKKMSSPPNGGFRPALTEPQPRGNCAGNVIRLYSRMKGPLQNSNLNNQKIGKVSESRRINGSH